MTKEQRAALETRYARLSPPARGLFLSASIEHVAGAFERVSRLDEAIRTECVAAAVALLRSPVRPSAESVRSLVESCERIGQIDAASAINALVYACAAAVETIAGNGPMRFALNSLDEVVSTNDPDGEEDAELGWRLRLLDVLEKGDHAKVTKLVGESLDWERRFNERLAS